MLKLILRFFGILFCCCCYISADAQSVIIKGRVLDELTNEPIPFVNILVQGTRIGCASDSLGKFQLQSTGGRKRDTLLIAAMGYELQKVPISPLSDQFLSIELKPTAINLKEAVIKPGENPALRILRKIMANKSNNNPDQLDAYQYKAYHKVEFDMNNFTEKIKKNIFLRSFSFIFNNADTTADGVTYLPILLTESSSDFYFRKDPPARKELVKARRSVGLKGPKIMKFAEDMYLAPDIYNEFVLILDKNFPSPINNNYKAAYRYYLIDSLFLNNTYCYYLQFKPKQKEDIAFTGEMYVDAVSYAVIQIDLSFSITANVNFVRNYWIRQQYEKVDSIHTMLHKSQVIGDFTVVENSKEMTGFFGRKTSVYQDYKINLPQEDNFYKNLDRITFEDSATIRDESFWQKARIDSLSAQEKSIVSMIDTLEKQAKFRLLKNSVKSISSGWIPLQKFEIGDFYSFYSYNNIEKNRLKVGIRAQQLFDNRFSFKTYIAYGTFDEQLKYFAESKITITRFRSKETRVGGMLKKDLMQPGRSATIFPLDHVLSSLSNLGSYTNRSIVNNKELFLERQWVTGFTTRITVFQSTWLPLDELAYTVKYNNVISYQKPSFAYAGLKLSARFAFGERNLSAAFGDGTKGNLFPNYPVISFNCEKGIQDFLKGEFNSTKLKLRIEDKLRIARFGYSLLRIEGGKTWGRLPYTFLETPLANPLLFNDETAFNLLNYLEFVSDQYLSIMWEHHFEGLLFNRIPLIKKLKWRELFFAKMYAGTLSNSNKNSEYALPKNTTYLTQPYFEIGMGIENIFKFSRVDFLWRLNYNNKEDGYQFLAKPMFQFKF